MRYLLLFLIIGISLDSQAQQLPFQKVAITDIPQGSRGVSIADLDGNGLRDIVVANQVDSTQLLGNTIYFNHQDGYKRVTLAEGRADAWSESVHTVDVDNDGDLDLFFTTLFDTPNQLYLNDGKGGFTAAEAGDLTANATSAPGACWCDYDRDGDLDVFVVNREGAEDQLYVNDGKGRFQKVWTAKNGDGRACAWGDLNGDGTPDLYVVNFVRKENGVVVGKHTNQLYWNKGDGTFEQAKEGMLVTTENATYGISMVDFDYDHDLDIYITNVAASDVNTLYENDGRGNFKELADNALSYQLRRPSKGQTWGDFNNDGWLDVYVANGTEGYPEIQNFFFLGQPNGSFKRIYNTLPAIEGHISAGTASGDLDNDGDLDLYVCNWGNSAEANDLYTNLGEGNNWIKFQLQGIASNRFGIGSWITLTMADGRMQTRYVARETGYGSQNAPEIHFGLGTTERVEKIVVEWPLGTLQKAENLKPNALYTIVEGKEIIPKDP